MNEQTDASDLVDVFVTNATATTDGPGPGHKRLPRAEAGQLVNRRLATYGSEPPRGYGHQAETGLNGR